MTDSPGKVENRLSGGWLILARSIWAGLILLTLGIFIASAPARFMLREINFIVVEVVLLIAYTTIALVIVWRKPADWMALFVSLFLVTFGATLSPSWDELLESDPSWSIPVNFVRILGLVLLLLFLYLFPDGRFVPRWTRLLTIALIALVLVSQPIGPLKLPDPFSSLSWFIFLGSGLVAQIYRYMRVSNPVQRQQTKWVVFGLAAFIVGSSAAILPGVLFPSLNQPGPLNELYDLGNGIISIVSLILLPLSIGIAIYRYRLWEIDVLIRRTLIYATLTATLALVYFGSVIALQTFLRYLTSLKQTELVTVVSTLAIAALFVPLRLRIQSTIDRRFYRRKYNAEKTLADFSARLRDEVDLEKITYELLQVVEETMQPGNVSLWLLEQEKGLPKRQVMEAQRLQV